MSRSWRVLFAVGSLAVIGLVGCLIAFSPARQSGYLCVENFDSIRPGNPAWQIEHLLGGPAHRRDFPDGTCSRTWSGHGIIVIVSFSSGDTVVTGQVWTRDGTPLRTALPVDEPWVDRLYRLLGL